MSGSVGLLARSALEVKAKGLATPVGVPSGQRRSPYHGGVCHRELMCSPGVARRRVTRMAGVKLNNGNTGTTTWSLQQYIVVCLVILAVQSQGNLVDANIWSLPPHSGVPQNVAREVGRCNRYHCMW